jgi:hypothetical protein
MTQIKTLTILMLINIAQKNSTQILHDYQGKQGTILIVYCGFHDSYSKMLIYLHSYLESMRKLLTIVKALFQRKVSIESVGKYSVSKSPGDVTEIRHN